jgi:hypothetical protein
MDEAPSCSHVIFATEQAPLADYDPIEHHCWLIMTLLHILFLWYSPACYLSCSLNQCSTRALKRLGVNVGFSLIFLFSANCLCFRFRGFFCTTELFCSNAGFSLVLFCFATCSCLSIRVLICSNALFCSNAGFFIISSFFATCLCLSISVPCCSNAVACCSNAVAGARHSLLSVVLSLRARRCSRDQD